MQRRSSRQLLGVPVGLAKALPEESEEVPRFH
jgi:hypothetical protein